MLKQSLNLVGETYGRLVVLEKVDPYISPDGKKASKWLCKCSCGTEVEVVGNHLRKGNTQSCGCLREERLKDKCITHGLSKSKEYKTWSGMKKRCYNINAEDYSYYGGRGITICPEWINDFPAFYNYVGKAPSPNHSIDRIDENGNYEPGNVEWSTSQIQALRRREIFKNNTSGCKGVAWHKRTNKWQAYITIKGKRTNLGSYIEKADAIKARKAAELKYHAPLLKKAS